MFSESPDGDFEVGDLEGDLEVAGDLAADFRVALLFSLVGDLAGEEGFGTSSWD